MHNYLELAAYLCIIYAIFLVNKKLNRMIEQDKITRKWLFDSLYSINHAVKLPEELEKNEFKQAIVLSDATDPYNELDGRKDDWHA